MTTVEQSSVISALPVDPATATVTATSPPVPKDGSNSNNDNNSNKEKRPKKRSERDSLVKRDSPEKDGRRRRNRRDNNNFAHHPFAVLDPDDLVPPGYDNEITSFHFVYDSVVDYWCRALADQQVELILNGTNPRKHSRQSDDENNNVNIRRRRPKVPREMRKRLKKSHHPSREILRKYETELVGFLDRLSVKNSGEEEERRQRTTGKVKRHDSGEWIVVKQGKQEERVVDEYDDGVIVERVDSEEEEILSISSASDVETISTDRNNDNIPLDEVFLIWEIGDRFSRWVVHTMCQYYDLMSFSKDSQEGRRLTYVCHPICVPDDFDEVESLKLGRRKVHRRTIELPEKSFFDYLYV